MENIKTIVKGTTAKLDYICNGKCYYNIQTEDHLYQLEIDTTADEWKTTYAYTEFKTINLMRWIRKGMENGKFQMLR